MTVTPVNSHIGYLILHTHTHIETHKRFIQTTVLLPPDEPDA